MAEKNVQVTLTDKELALVERYARMYGLNNDEAASRLAAARIREEVRRVTGQSVASQVRDFPRGGA